MPQMQQVATPQQGPPPWGRPALAKQGLLRPPPPVPPPDPPLPPPEAPQALPALPKIPELEPEAPCKGHPTDDRGLAHLGPAAPGDPAAHRGTLAAAEHAAHGGDASATLQPGEDSGVARGAVWNWLT